MGFGNYSLTAHDALLKKRSNLPRQEIFKQVQCHPLMNPKGVRLRESRDSADHPQSQGVVFALDVTGSMGEIPRLLATSQLPKFMKVLMDCQIPDPQILFMAVGDAISDNAPLQVGQFESTAELMDKWLTYSYLEGGGGGSGEESYELGMYFLSMHTEMDCMVKRQKRGYLFMTGDENPYPTLSRHIIETVIGDSVDEDLSCEEILAELQKSYVPFFIIPDRQRAKRCERRWRDLLGDNVLCLESPAEVCFAAAGAILLCESRVSSLTELAETLEKTGLTGELKNSVIRSLTPFAEVIFNRSL
ncbi:MAG: VWA domain-containing protein [Leptolinea sp.]|nr:VWA domain-containing protein [Leptolinea sp.]